MALTDKLTNIANAIRQKGGTTEQLTLDAMPTAINALPTGGGGIIEALDITTNGTYTAPEGIDGYNPITVNVPQNGAPTDEELTLTGTLDYAFISTWNWLLNKYSNRIKTSNITSISNMCRENKTIETFPNIAINFPDKVDNNIANWNYAFYLCDNLKEINLTTNSNKISGIASIFQGCKRLRNLPNFFINADFSLMNNNTIGMFSNAFNACHSLRTIPTKVLNKIYNAGNANYYTSLNSLFNECCSLDEINGIYLRTNYNYTSNVFSYTFKANYRIKNLTFYCEDGIPLTINAKSQIIDLSDSIGWATSRSYILDYNSGITADKEVVDDATYQALKDNPDWFTRNIAYSRYNHDSAVATINTLPDTSAYLASAGGTNTIKFRGSAGSATDGGAISSLTSEEIAVATSRGWTVSLV